MKIWLSFLRNNSYAMMFVIICFVLCATLFNYVLVIIENNQGIIFEDPLFKFYNAIDLSPYIFLMTYGSLFSFMFLNRLNPKNYYLFIKAYVLLLLFRSISVFLLPLACCEDAIPLNDPILNGVFYPNGYSCRDLFFSGHAATIFLMNLFSENKNHKLYFGLLTALVSIGVLLQKVHYSIDVLAAPVFAILIYKMTKYNFPRLKNAI